MSTVEGQDSVDFQHRTGTGRRRARHAFVLALATATALAVAAPAGASAGKHTSKAHRAKATISQVTLVQAVPSSTMDLVVDGKTIKPAAGVGDVVGPLQLSPGAHTITFTPAGGTAVTTSVNVAAGSSSDVVIHRPAAVNGAPVINTYETPLSPIGPGKARLMLAHTATVAPADVSFDGQVVFKNIANGEFAQADVPAGAHIVSLLPAGQTTDPILGPLDVALKARTLTMVYAVGTPANGSMKVITHTISLSGDGASAPRRIKTGSAGLAAGLTVRAFGGAAGARAGALCASAVGSAG